MTVKLRRAFWITNSVTAIHTDRAKQLETHGFAVVFAPDSGTAHKLAREARPICVLVDTPLTSWQTEISSLKSLINDPEFNAVRFILSITDQGSNLGLFAISENFRDVIPMAIGDRDWLNRILYANAAKSFENFHSYPEVEVNQIASTISSGRITWINQTHIKVECRAPQRIGAAFHVSGAIAQALNVPHVNLVVESIEKHRLVYRYSQALVCRWQVAPKSSNNAQKIVERLLTEKPEPKFRAFLAISRPAVRATIAKGLSSERFFVRAALQKSNLAHEVSYLSPNIIFFDDKLLASLSQAELKTILENAPTKTPLVVFGVDSAELRERLAGRKVFFETSVQQSHLKSSESRYNIPAEEPEFEICTIPPEHPWSKIDVHTPARLSSLSPVGGHFTSPFSIGDYALAKIESPFLKKILGRDPIIKIKSTRYYDSSSMFGYESTFHLSDVSANEQSLIAVALLEMLQEHYAASKAQVNLHSQTSIPQESTSTSWMQGNLLLDIANNTTAVAGGSFDGTSALKQPANPQTHTGRSSELSHSVPREQGPDPATKPSPPNATFKIARKAKSVYRFDPTVVKAIGMFILFSIALIFALRFAEQMGKQRGSQLGKEYTDFFFRMNPELRKKSQRQGQDTSP